MSSAFIFFALQVQFQKLTFDFSKFNLG